MKQEEYCLFCRTANREREMIAWFFNFDRLAIHSDCWITAYHAGRESSLKREPEAAPL